MRPRLSLQFWKCRKILTKCREGQGTAALKTVGCHEWYEVLQSTARREGVATATLASANDLLKELFKRGLSASEAIDCLKKDEWIRNSVREEGI
jgi:hypothetical protein